MHFRLACLSALAIPGVALAQAPAAIPAPAEIGSVTAANQAVTGTPPGGAQRPLVIGAGVVSEERIQTAAIGAGQFLFLDQTALNVWPNSDIVLDRYFYDAERSVGDIGVSLTRGVLRFIGGRISKDSDAEIRTPFAIAVVRGGIAQVGGGLSASYARQGGFSMDYDFAARAGSVTLTNILAAPVATAVADTTGGFGINHFGGAAPGGGLVAGAFFDGAGAPAAAAGVFFGLRGTGVDGGAAVADGVFGGDRR